MIRWLASPSRPRRRNQVTRTPAREKDVAWTVLDASALVHDLKLVKSPAELALVRKAASIADAALETIRNSIADGVTESEVAGEAYRTLLRRGSDLPASPMNFVSGERTCYGHGQPTTKPIRAGEFMHVEFGAAVKRYCSTIARHFNLGEPAKRTRELHDIIRESCDACIAEIKAGVPAVRPHEAAKRGVSVTNTGREPLVSLRYFGPDAFESVPKIGDYR